MGGILRATRGPSGVLTVESHPAGRLPWVPALPVIDVCAATVSTPTPYEDPRDGGVTHGSCRDRGGAVKGAREYFLTPRSHSSE